MTPFFCRHFAQIEKIRIWAVKKSRKIDKKMFFSGLATNSLKLPKSPKNLFSDRYSSIQSHFLAKNPTPKYGILTIFARKETKKGQNPKIGQLLGAGYGVTRIQNLQKKKKLHFFRKWLKLPYFNSSIFLFKQSWDAFENIL